MARKALRQGGGLLLLGLLSAMHTPRAAWSQTSLLSEDFEGIFPVSNIWYVADTNPAGTNAFWGSVGAAFGFGGAHSGSLKGYCAGSGYSGSFISPIYRDNMEAGMSHSANLTGYSQAILRFWSLIPSIESCCDAAQVYVIGIDPSVVWSQNTPEGSWKRVVLNLQDFVGSTASVKFNFSSDYSVVGEGWYLDDIALLAGHGPLNDFFDAPTILSNATGSITASSVGAGKEPFEPAHAGNLGGRSLWFNWRAASSAQVQFNTVGSGFDTLLAVYRGDMVNALTQVAANDDIEPGNVPSQVVFAPVAGQWYGIVVDGYNAQEGSVTLNWGEVGAPPALVSVSSHGNPTGVTVTFSEPVTTSSGLNVANYAISQGVTVVNAAFGASQSVVQLQTSPLTEVSNYLVTVQNVRDLDLNLISPNPSYATLQHGVEYPRFRILRQRYDIGPGVLLSDLTNHPAFPGSPTSFSFLSAFEMPVDAGDGYGCLLSGTFVAPTTGFYKFYMSSDDQGATYLATDSLPIHKTMIAFEPVWNGSRDYLGTVRRNPTNPENRSNLVYLAQNQEVYLEALVKEGVGGDNLSVAVQWPGATNPPTAPISGLYFAENRYFNGTTFRTLGPVIITLSPTNQTVAEGQSATFSAAVDGTPPYSVQWFRNGVAVPGATQLVHTIAPVHPVHGGLYQAQVANPFSSTNSATATLTILADTIPPTLLSATADPSFQRVTVRFSEPVAPDTATNATNYRVDNFLGQALPISGILLQNGSEAIILLDQYMDQNRAHTVTVSNIRDTSTAANLIAPNSRVGFSSWLIHPRLVLKEYYDGIGPGNSVSLLTTHPKFPHQPDLVVLSNTFATIPDRADLYGARVSAYFVPGTSELHRFYARGDDDFEFWISTTFDPANKVLAIAGPSCCQPFSSNASPALFLSSGQPYYVEGLVKENSGGDYLQVSVKPASSLINPDSLEPIPEQRLACAANPDRAGPITITQHPTSTSVEEYHAATFRVTAVTVSNAPPFIQWQVKRGPAAWEFIDAANGPTYTTPPAQLSDSGTRFRAVVNVPGRIVYSDDGLLTVAADLTPPQLLSASSVNAYEVGACFSETLDLLQAQDPVNYLVSGANVLEAVLQADGRSVLLKLDTPVSAFSVTAMDILDLAGNQIAPGATVPARRWATAFDVGSPTPAGASFSCREGDVDVQAGGADIWDTSDQFHFVFQPVLNDFDVQVKIVRLDPSDPWAKAGLMARENLQGESATIQVLTAPAEFPGVGVLQAIRRVAPNGSSTDWGSRPPTTLPELWLRLCRTGDTFLGFHSPNGLDWYQFAETTQDLSSELLVGMATTSHNTSQTTVAEYRDFQFASMGTIILEPPLSQVVLPDSTVVLSVTAAGPGPFQYQWRLNGNSLLGETNATLVLSNVVPANAGSYSAVVLNSLGIETSTPADLVVTGPDLPFQDDFEQATVLDNYSGFGLGSNVGATAQSGEPRHVGKTGGKSVWLAWQPNVQGIATLSTAGSGFDTLLAVYRGDLGSKLTELAANDDAGRHYTSSVRFNTEPGVTYHVAVDGLAGASGNIVLSWDLVESTNLLPVIYLHPQSRSVLRGQPATLSVVASNALTYQWYFNGVALSNAAFAPTFFIPSMQPANVGTYQVAVRSSSSILDQTVRTLSRPAVLEIGPVPGVVSQDKLEDILAIAAGQAPGLNRLLSSFGTPSGTLIPVAAGTLGNQTVNNKGSGTGPTDPNSCRQLGNASRWLILRSTSDSVMEFQIDTGGSSVATILAVYRSQGILGNRSEETCAADNTTSNFVFFPAQPGFYYWVVVDGAQRAEDIISISWKLGSRPVITAPPQNTVARLGSNATFQVSAEGLLSPLYYWSVDGLPTPGQHGASLTLQNVSAPASITVLASNFMGTAQSGPAELTISQPFTLGFERYRTNSIRFMLTNSTLANRTYVVEGTTDFINWAHLFTNQTGTVPTYLILSDYTNFPRRFYRVVEWQ